jgi:hypothetical protein
MGYVNEHLFKPTDEHFLARSVAAELAPLDASVRDHLLDAYQSEPSLERLALLADADIAMTPQLREGALVLVSDALARIREQAARGEYGFGGVEVALLMFKLIGRTPRDPRWSVLLDFLLDPRVGIGQKTTTLDALASTSAPLPKAAISRLRESLRDITGFTDDLTASRHALRGSALRLWFRVGGGDRNELLGLLLQLAGDSDSEARREGARTLPAAQPTLGDAVVVTLALSMSRDRDYSVRATAARSLALLRIDERDEIAAVANDRLESLLEDAGADAPLEALAGLIQSQRAGSTLAERVLEAAARTRHSHPSRRVQALADLLLSESDGRTAL